ncbi:hypothetical protein, partial [Agrobacterium pusense]|uniref:hypothetical protein n=1 Tax=Agrobacterium pusense TaxID=648995 RepID=UPI001AED2E63
PASFSPFPHPSQIGVQNGKKARAKVDVLIAERLSGIYRNRCPGISGNAVPDLVKSLFGI